jgi:hypothetical protein
MDKIIYAGDDGTPVHIEGFKVLPLSSRPDLKFLRRIITPTSLRLANAASNLYPLAKRAVETGLAIKAAYDFINDNSPRLRSPVSNGSKRADRPSEGIRPFETQSMGLLSFPHPTKGQLKCDTRNRNPGCLQNWKQQTPESLLLK